MSENCLTVLTYNIHKGFSPGNRRYLLHQIRSALMAVDADILCLQELQSQHNGHEKRIKTWPDCAQAEFLGKGTWPYIAYGQNAT